MTARLYSVAAPELQAAVWEGDPHSVTNALVNGADPDFSVQNGPALLEAVRAGHPRVAKALLKAGAVVTWRHAEQAALYNRVGLLKVFLAEIMSADRADGHGDTLLMSAAFGGHIQVAQTLLDAGVKVNASNGNGWTALLSAASCGHVDVGQTVAITGSGCRCGRQGRRHAADDGIEGRPR